MPGRTGPQLSDEELDRLARQWFAQARVQNSEPPAAKPDPAGDTDVGLLDWLFGDDDAGDDGGD